MTNVYFNLNQMQHPCRRTMVGWTGTPSENREKIEPRECGLTHDHHGTISYAQPIHTPTQPWRESGARVAKYVAMIFAVLVMSVANVGMAWGADITINSSTSSSDALFSVSETMTNYTYSGYWEASAKLIKFNTGSSITVTNVTGATITAISVEGVADNNSNKTVNFTGSDGTTSAVTSSGSWNNRKSTTLTSKPLNSTNVNKFKCDAGQTYTITNNSSSSYNAGARVVITYTSTLPTSLTNGATTSSTQTISWTAPSTAPANGYLVAYSTSSTAPGNSVTSTSGSYTVAAISAGTTSASLSELSAGTTYYWWVRSRNARGNSSWVAGSSFTTDAAAPSGTNVYLKPNGIWNKDGARFAAYYFKSADDSDNGWIDFEDFNTCTPVSKAVIPSGYDKVILCRMDGTKAANNWDNKWNQTLDLTVPTGNDTLYTISSINGCTEGKSCGSWGTYTPPTYTISYSANGGTGTTTSNTGIACGGSATLTANGFTYAGYSFNCWHADVATTVGGAATAAGADIAGGSSLTNITSDITMTAQWTQEKPTSVAISGGWRYFPGQTVGLKAKPTGGTDSFTYRWQKYVTSAWEDLEDGLDETGGTFSGVTTDSLQISGCTAANSGKYRCVVSKAGGSTESGEYGVHIYTLNGNYHGSDWTSNDITLSSGTTGTVSLDLEAGRLYKFKIKDNYDNSWFGNAGYMLQSASSWACPNNVSNDIRVFTGGEGTYTFTVDIDHTNYGTPEVVVSVTYPSVTHPAEGYVYFTNPSSWSNVVAYWWKEGDPDVEFAAWASSPWMFSTTICENTYYYMPKLEGYDRVIFYDSANGSNKTGDIEVAAANSGQKHDGSSWGDFLTYTITFAENGGTGTMSDINGICPNADQVLTVNAYEKTGHTFANWTADVNVKVGGETVSAGSSIANQATIQNISGNVTLTAQWTADTYDITYMDGESAFAGTHADGYPTTHTYGTETTLKSATKTGYTLEGWYTEAELENKVTSLGATAYTDDITLYAKWTANEYSITYMDGESAFAGTHEDGYPTTHTYGTATTLKGATKTGYTLEGWYTEAGLENKVTSLGATAYTDDITLYAKWTAVYTVTFNSNGGSSVASQLVAAGETAEEPTDPTRTNWTFGSWQLNGSDYNFSTTVTGNITLDATWSRNSISGGSATEDLVADDLQEAGEENGIPYEGTAFDIVKKDGTVTITKDYSDATHEGDSKTFSYAFLPSNATAEDKCYKLTANKDISSLVVYYTATDSKFSSKDQSKSGIFTYKKNTDDAVTSTTTGDKSNKTAYKETISSISKGDSVKIYNSANRLAIFAIYATYTADPYTVTITGYAEDGSDSTMNVTSGETLGNLFADGVLPTENRDGFDITGWKDASDDSDVTASTVISSTMTIYPDVDIPEYTITLDKGDGDEGGEATVKLTDKALTITTAPSYDDYLLEGYYTTNDKDAVKVADSEGNLIASVTGYTDASGKWIKESDVTLYAQWSAITFCSTFTVSTSESGNLAADDVVVGTGAAEITVVGVGSAESMAYTNRGLQFSASGDSVDVSLPNLIAEGSVIRLEFYWGAASTDKNRGLTLKSTSGTKIQAMTWKPAAAESKKLYYIVKSTDTELIGTNKFRLVREENTVYLASVSLGECGSDVLYGVTYNANGGSCETASETQASFGASVTLPTPTWSGYTFEGWYNAGTKIGDAGDSYTPTADITLYAHWTDNISGKVFSFIDNNYGDKFKAFDLSDWVTGNATGKSKTYTNGDGVQYSVSAGCWDKKNNAISSLAKFKGGTSTMSVVIPTGKIATVKISYNAYGAGDDYRLTVNSTAQANPSTKLTDGMTNAEVIASMKEITLSNQTGTLTLGISKTDKNNYIGRVSAVITGYVVTYAKGSADGASGDSFTGTKTAGSSFTLSSSGSAFTRDGFIYDGWSVNADGSTKDYNLGDSYTTDAVITLYPHWAEITTFNGNVSGEWDNKANWSGGALPTINNAVVIENKNIIVNVGDAQAATVILSGTSTLTVQANKALVVDGKITKNGSAPTASDLVLESGASGNATLIFENSNSAAATVQMYSIGSTDGSNWTWQYIGVPFEDANAQATYYGAYLYKWNNGWTAVQKSDELEEFAGYCISYPAANYTYVMDGTLASTTEQSITISAGKSMVVGNSWTAPIQITQLEDADFDGLLKNVYLYNTGNDAADTASTTSNPTGDAIYAAGTYISVPIHTAEYTGVKVISSLQGFFVKDDHEVEGGGTLNLSYSKHVRPSGGNSVVNGPMHAPKRVADEINRPAVLKMKVSGSQYDDRLILLEREDFTTGYDAGWDGDKMGDVATSPRITTTREDGTADAVAALPDLEGTLINFRAASTDDQYTLYFDYETEDAEPLYLLDLTNNAYTRVETGSSYTFFTTDKADHKRFALTRYRAPQITTGVEDTSEDNGQGKAVKFIENDKLYILRNGVLYDGTGKKVIEN